MNLQLDFAMLSQYLPLGLAVAGILIVGSTHIRLNIWLLAFQTALLSATTAIYAWQTGDMHLLGIAFALLTLKAVGIPSFLAFVVHRVQVQRDSGALIPSPLALHLSIALLAGSYLIASHLPASIHGSGWAGATAALSLVFTGLLIMLTRRIALSQIIGFLVLENGIYLFGLTQTQGMPMMIEMGIMLDVLVGVMISGLLAFRIQKSFEHVDVTMLTELKD